MEKEGAWEVNFKQATIKMSDGSVFAGKVNIRSNFKRLSEFLRQTDDRFIVILADEEQHQRVIMVNKNFILWVEASD